MGKCSLKSTIQKLPEQLETSISNVSEVLSVGQKQLLCLARALLRNNKILVLDEATANVDMETDRLIQECLQTHFKNTSVITIAHRLNTIAGYDKVIVLRKGRIAEMGSPWKLIEKDGYFREMVESSNSAHAIKAIAKAKKDH